MTPTALSTSARLCGNVRVCNGRAPGPNLRPCPHADPETETIGRERGAVAGRSPPAVTAYDAVPLQPLRHGNVRTETSILGGCRPRGPARIEGETFSLATYLKEERERRRLELFWEGEDDEDDEAAHASAAKTDAGKANNALGAQPGAAHAAETEEEEAAAEEPEPEPDGFAVPPAGSMPLVSRKGCRAPALTALRHGPRVGFPPLCACSTHW